MTNPKILIIETSGRIGTVAAGCGLQLLASQTFSDALRHSGEMVPSVAAICNQLGWKAGDLDHIYVSYGPGSFTGIRLAVTLAKTLAYACGVKIVPVPSLEAQVLGLEAAPHLDSTIQTAAVVLEAGRGQLFAAVYRKNQDWHPDRSQGSFAPGYDLLLPETSIKPADLLARTPRPLVLLGEGLHYHPKAFLDQPGVMVLPSNFSQPRAEQVHRCGWYRAQAGLFADPEQLIPNYLRRPEAMEKWEERHGA